MADCILAMKTHTEAERARRIGLIEKIPTEIVNIDPSVTKRGCSVGIRLHCAQAEKFREALDKRKIPYGELIGGKH